jgi:predicted nucleotidyltransferase
LIKIKTVIQSLASHEVDFVIIGGVAIHAYSSAYLTDDFDFCYSRKIENLKKIVNALAPFKPRFRNFPKDLPFTWDERTLQGGTNFTLETEIGDIDLLGEVAGVGAFQSVKANSELVNFYGFEVSILTIDALIEAKKAAGRTKDLLILPELEGLKDLIAKVTEEE